MDGQVVAAGQHIAQRDTVLHTAGQAPRSINGNIRVIAQNLHAQRDGGVGHARTDGTQPDDAQRLAAQLGTDEGLFALLHVLGNRVAALEGLRPVHGIHQIAAARDQRTDDELGHGVGVGARRVEHDDALVRAVLHGNVVRTGTCAGDGQQAVGQRGIVHIGAAHQNALRCSGLVVDLKLVGGQLGQTHRRNGVQCFDSIHISLLPVPLILRRRGRACPALSLTQRPSHGWLPQCRGPDTPDPCCAAAQCSLRNFSIKSTSLSMPSAGMAL